MRCAVVIEKAGAGYSGYGPGSVAAGSSMASLRAALAEVTPFHLEGLRQDGQTMPPPEIAAKWIEV